MGLLAGGGMRSGLLALSVLWLLLLVLPARALDLKIAMVEQQSYPTLRSALRGFLIAAHELAHGQGPISLPQDVNVSTVVRNPHAPSLFKTQLLTASMTQDVAEIPEVVISLVSIFADQRATASRAAYRSKLPLISPYGASLSDPASPNLVTAGASLSATASAAVQVLGALGYKSFALLYLQNGYGLETATLVLTKARETNVHNAIAASFLPNSNSELPKEVVEGALQAIMATGCRVIIAATGSQYLQQTLSLAAQNGMAQADGFQWIIMSDISSIPDKVFAEVGLDGAIGVSNAAPSDSENGEALSHFRHVYEKTDIALAEATAMGPTQEKISLFSVIGYEAFWIAVQAIDRALANQDDPRNRTAMMEALMRTSFISMLGCNITFDNTGSGPACLDIKQVQQDHVVLLTRFTEEKEKMGEMDQLHLTNNFSFYNASPLAPANFGVDTCPGAEQYREQGSYTCLTCEGKTINVKGDGQDRCFPCPLGTQLVKTECLPCAAGTEAAMVDGYAACMTVKKFPYAAVFVPLAAVLVLLVVALVRMRVKRLQREALQAEERAAAQNSFVGFVFHELRNPLGGVMGHLSFCEERVSTTLLEFAAANMEKNTQKKKRNGAIVSSASSPCKICKEELPLVQQDISFARQSMDHVMEVLNSVLDLARLVEGKLVLNQMPFDAVGVSRACVAILGKTVEPGVDLRGDYSGMHALWVTGDGLRLRQVLLNLLGNAIKFTSQGYVAFRLSVVDSEGEAHSHDKAHAHDKRPMIAIKFEVIDTGPGVSPEDQEHLFDDCPKRVRFKAGAGIGLSLSWRLVALMGGRIELRSPMFVPEQDAPHTVHGKASRRSRTEDKDAVLLHKASAHNNNNNKDAVLLHKASAHNNNNNNNNNNDKDAVLVPYGSCFTFTITLPAAEPPRHEMKLRHRSVDPEEEYETSAKPVPRPSSTSKFPPLDIEGESSNPNVLNRKKECVAEAEANGVSDLPRGKEQEVHVDAGIQEPACAKFLKANVSSPLQSVRRVLIVEDDAVNRKLMRRMFTTGNFKGKFDTVDEAVNAETALELLGLRDYDSIPESWRSPYDLLTVDEHLERANGVLLGHEFVRIVRKAETTAGVPLEKTTVLVHVTGSVEGTNEALFLQAGSDLVLSKPMPARKEMLKQLGLATKQRRQSLPEKSGPRQSLPGKTAHGQHNRSSTPEKKSANKITRTASAPTVHSQDDSLLSSPGATTKPTKSSSFEGNMLSSPSAITKGTKSSSFEGTVLSSPSATTTKSTVVKSSRFEG